MSADKEIYLTNGMCEDVSNLSPQNEALAGLTFTDDGNGFYPLDEHEGRLVAEDDVAIGPWRTDGAPDRQAGVLMGYSTLREGKKFLAPAIELAYGGDDGDDETVAAQARSLVDLVRPAVEATGGTVEFVENGGPDRHVVEIRVPMTYALENAENYQEWAVHLKDVVLGGMKPCPAPTPA